MLFVQKRTKTGQLAGLFLLAQNTQSISQKQEGELT